MPRLRRTTNVHTRGSNDPRIAISNDQTVINAPRPRVGAHVDLVAGSQPDGNCDLMKCANGDFGRFGNSNLAMLSQISMSSAFETACLPGLMPLPVQTEAPWSPTFSALPQNSYGQDGSEHENRSSIPHVLSMDDHKELHGISNLPKESSSPAATIALESTVHDDVANDRDSARIPWPVLRTYPLTDTLTVLVILLSLPSTLLTIINAIFALLTFYSPTRLSLPLDLSSHEVVDSRGPFSVLTVAMTDIIGLVLWFLISTPVKFLALDYAQAIIATSLGRAMAEPVTNWDMTILCISIVTGHRYLCQNWMSEGDETFPRFTNASYNASLSEWDSIQMASSPSAKPWKQQSQGTWTLINILLALHIVTQCLVQFGRQWLRDHSEFTPSAESNAGSITRILLKSYGSGLSLPKVQGHLRHFVDQALNLMHINRTSSASSSPRSGSRIENNKNLAPARTRQSLWTAFASPKLSILRGFGFNIQKAENGYSDKGSDFRVDESRIRVRGTLTELTASSCSFQLIVSHEHPTRHAYGSDMSPLKAFSSQIEIFVNDSAWSMYEIQGLDSIRDSESGLTIKICHLLPNSTYSCRVLLEDDVVIEQLTVTTLPASIKEELDTSDLMPLENEDRQESPKEISSNTANIITSKVKAIDRLLAHQRYRRKEAKLSAATMRKDIEVLAGRDAKIQHDGRVVQNRVTQLNQQIRHFEELTLSLAEQMEMLEREDEKDLVKRREHKLAWEEAQKELLNARNHLNIVQDETSKDLVLRRQELLSAQQKTQRLEGRRDRLREQWDKLTQKDKDGEDDGSLLGSAHDLPSEATTNQSAQERQLEEQMIQVSQAWQHSRLLHENYLAQIRAFEENGLDQRDIVIPAKSNGRPSTPEQGPVCTAWDDFASFSNDALLDSPPPS